MTARGRPGDGSLYFDHRGTACVDLRPKDKRKHPHCEGRWTGVVDLGIVDGRRRRPKVSDPSWTEAKRKLDELKAQATSTGTVVSGSLTVAMILAELLGNPPDTWKSEITKDVNQDHADRIVAGLGPVKVTRLDVPQVERFLKAMAARKYSTSTISRTRSVLRAALHRAQRDHGLARNVADLADVPQGTVRVSRAMTPGEIDALLGSKLTAFWLCWATMAIRLGLRPGELTGLTWDDLDFKARTVRIRHCLKLRDGELVLEDLKPESSKGTIAMPADVVDALKALKVQQAADRLAVGAAYTDRGLIFADEAGGAVDGKRIRLQFMRMCRLAGITPYTPRETRHTTASNLNRNGVPREEISALLRHKNLNITNQVYVHVFADDVITTAATGWDKKTEASAS